MKVVVQRVLEASVEVDGKEVSRTGRGLLVYLGVARGDEQKDAQFLADKLVNLRIFSDDQDKMNLGIKDIGGQMMIVSNFTLQGDCRKGRRPGFDLAAEPKLANELYEYTVSLVKTQGIGVKTGIFAASMKVSSVNDGPVTFIIDSKA